MKQGRCRDRYNKLFATNGKKTPAKQGLKRGTKKKKA
jgi:hypothetical protein